MEVKKFLFSILIIFSLFFIFSFGFYLGTREARIVEKVVEKKVPKVIVLETPKLIEKRYYNVTGFVKEIDYQSHIVTLTMNGDEMRVRIDTDKVKSFAIRHIKPDQAEPSEVSFRDILVGDKLTTFVEEKENGELIGTNAYLHFVGP
jgi:hypothetical protein